MENVTSLALAAKGNIRLKQTRHGLMLYNINDVYIGRSLDCYGEHSHHEALLFAQIIKPGMTVLDVGANIGVHTLYFADAVGLQGRVYAFEPQRIVHQMLGANMALNGITNVHTIQAGVGRESGHGLVPSIDYNQPGNFGGISLSTDGGDQITIVTIDSLVLNQCHFIKIDVEGMEEDVIAGATQTISKFRPILYVENDRQEKSPPLIRQCLDMGYRLYWHLPPLYNPNNIYGNSNNLFPGIVSINMIGVPQELDLNVVRLKEITHPNEWPLS